MKSTRAEMIATMWAELPKRVESAVVVWRGRELRDAYKKRRSEERLLARLKKRMAEAS